MLLFSVHNPPSIQTIQEKLFELKSINKKKNLLIDDIDFKELLNNEKPLYSCDAEVKTFYLMKKI